MRTVTDSGSTHIYTGCFCWTGCMNNTWGLWVGISQACFGLVSLLSYSIASILTRIWTRLG